MVTVNTKKTVQENILQRNVMKETTAEIKEVATKDIKEGVNCKTYLVSGRIVNTYMIRSTQSIKKFKIK